MENRDAIHKAFETLTKAPVSVDETDEDTLEEKLGNLFRDYMVGSVYDTDWEGFTNSELEGIRALLEDMVLFKENQ